MRPLTFGAATDIGPVRHRNEDRWTAYPAAGLYIVSDGMGGASHGELAAQIVVDVLPGYVRERRGSHGGACQGRGELASAIAELSDELHTRSKSVRVKGAGATVVAVVIDDSGCAIAYLGDSRAYLLRDGHLQPVTTDHTIAQALFEAGEITADEIARHPTRNQLRCFVGMRPPAKPDALRLDMRPSDRILLCTDGISGPLDADVLQRIACRNEPPQAVCDQLIAAAKEAGGDDNMTALLIDVGDTSRDATQPWAADSAPMPDTVELRVDW